MPKGKPKELEKGVFAHTLRQVIRELRKHLGNVEFNTSVLDSPEGCRMFYLSRFVNEVDKLCVKSLIMDDIDEGDIRTLDCQFYDNKRSEEKSKTDYWHTESAFLSLLVDEWSIISRKLTEMFVDLIGFSDADSDYYYLHHSILIGLAQLRDRIKDAEKSYVVDSKLDKQLYKVMESRADDLAQHLDVEKVWYTKLGNNKRLLPFSEKFLLVSKIMTDDQRFILKSPRGAMYHANLHLHYAGHLKCAYDDLETIKEEWPNSLMLICLNIIKMTSDILGISDNNSELLGICDKVIKVWRESPIDPNTKAERDFILIEDSSILAQVSQIKTVAHGVRSFKVRIPNQSLDKFSEEWIPATRTKLFWKYNDIKSIAETSYSTQLGKNMPQKELEKMIWELAWRVRYEFNLLGVNLTPPPNLDPGSPLGDTKV